MILRRWLVAMVMMAAALPAHDTTWPEMRAFIAQAEAQARVARAAAAKEPECRVRLSLLISPSNEPVAGLIRVTRAARPREPLALPELCERPMGWYAMPATADLRLPRARLRFEAVHGIETEITAYDVDLSASADTSVNLLLHRLAEPRAAGWRATNTHLHLIVDAPDKMGVTLRSREAADYYVQTTAHADGLDLVCVSYLTRPGDTYVSNEYTPADFARFSAGGRTLFIDGIEHRHAGPRYNGDSFLAYGHVMLAGIDRRAVVASIGAGLSEDSHATDGVPLRDGIAEARRRGAGIIWCHSTKGTEDIPDWIDGLLDAVNFYDSSTQGPFDLIYPYLNAGLKITLSSGTDWGVWDFSRVYVRAPRDFGQRVFLDELARGRTYITNEPLLDFSVGNATSGDTIELKSPSSLRVRGRAVSRSDFLRLQVVRNGEIVAETKSRPIDTRFEAEIDQAIDVPASGWLALRVPTEKPYDIRSRYTGPGTNILGKALFAHTSPVYVSVGGKPTADPAAIEDLSRQLDLAINTIGGHGRFANDAERDRVLQIYRDAKAKLEARRSAR